MQVSGALEDDFPSARGRGHDREISVTRELSDRLRLWVVREEIELAGAIGEEIYAAADGHGLGVIGPARGLRNLLDRMATRVEEKKTRSGAPAIVLPLCEGVGKRLVDDARSVREVSSL